MLASSAYESHTSNLFCNITGLSPTAENMFSKIKAFKEYSIRNQQVSVQNRFNILGDSLLAGVFASVADP
jgi:hypothetical protein